MKLTCKWVGNFIVATIWTSCASLLCFWREAGFWNPLLQIGQPVVISKCFLIWVNMQSQFLFWKAHSWHLYSLPPPGWFSHLGWASTGMASSRTIKIGYEVGLLDGPGEGGLLGNNVVRWLDWCRNSMTFWNLHRIWCHHFIALRRHRFALRRHRCNR